MKSTVARVRKNCPICAQNGGYWAHLTEKSFRDYMGEGGDTSGSSDTTRKKYIRKENVSIECTVKSGDWNDDRTRLCWEKILFQLG